jgi:MOSC domain-containing protein YiiM
VGSGFLEEGFGLRGDAHGGDWHRQVSLLSVEQIAVMKEKGLEVDAGSFAENITTEGFDLDSVQVGDRLRVGDSAVLEVTQIGKECHTRCAIYHKVGECIMPKQGVFAKVIRGGEIKTGDTIARA